MTACIDRRTGAPDRRQSTEEWLAEVDRRQSLRRFGDRQYALELSRYLARVDPENIPFQARQWGEL